MLTDTITDVGTSVVAQAGARRLEVDGVLDTSQVRAGQVGRTTHEVGDHRANVGKDDLGELARSLSGISRLVDWQGLLPVRRQLATDAARELGMLLGVLLRIRREEGVPLLLELGTAGGSGRVDVIGVLGDVEGLFRGEADLGLEGGDIVGLEGWGTGSVNARHLQQSSYLRAPWTPWVPCCLEPYPIVVRRRIIDGLFFSLRASAMAL